MRTSLTHRAAVVLAAAALAVVGLAPPTAAAGSSAASGSGTVATGDQCTDDPAYAGDNAPAGVPPLLFGGDLVGCYYTDTSDPRTVAVGGGRYRLIDRGLETFIGTLHGSPVEFRTRYVVRGLFQGDPLTDPDAQLLAGSCVHVLVDGGHGALLFVDDVSTGVIHYRGRIHVD